MPLVNLSNIVQPIEGRIWTEVVGGVTHIYVTAQALVTNDGGQQIPAPNTVELTTAGQKQAAQTILDAWVADTKTKWGIA